MSLRVFEKQSPDKQDTRNRKSHPPRRRLLRGAQGATRNDMQTAGFIGTWDLDLQLDSPKRRVPCAQRSLKSALPNVHSQGIRRNRRGINLRPPYVPIPVV